MLLLIVPYGIEIKYRHIANTISSRLLIVPYGIEIR